MPPQKKGIFNILLPAPFGKIAGKLPNGNLDQSPSASPRLLRGQVHAHVGGDGGRRAASTRTGRISRRRGRHSREGRQATFFLNHLSTLPVCKFYERLEEHKSLDKYAASMACAVLWDARVENTGENGRGNLSPRCPGRASMPSGSSRRRMPWNTDTCPKDKWSCWHGRALRALRAPAAPPGKPSLDI